MCTSSLAFSLFGDWNTEFPFSMFFSLVLHLSVFLFLRVFSYNITPDTPPQFWSISGPYIEFSFFTFSGLVLLLSVHLSLSFLLINPVSVFLSLGVHPLPSSMFSLLHRLQYFSPYAWPNHIHVNRPAFGGTVPHFYQMSRVPRNATDVPHF